MAFNVSVLGSGSAGNSVLIHKKKNGFLIDAGFSCKETMKRIDSLGINPSIIKALLITHEHGDHTKGARPLANKLDIPSYTSANIYRYLKERKKIGKSVKVFSPGTQFQIDNFTVDPFSIPHDAVETVGFRITSEGKSLSMASDIGYISKLAEQRLRDSNILILESNYDIKMLMDSNRSLSLKKRISGRRGHLDNADAARAVEKLITDNTSHLCMVHLSRDCNHPELVSNLLKQSLAKIKRNDILVNIAEQNKSLKTFSV